MLLLPSLSLCSSAWVKSKVAFLCQILQECVGYTRPNGSPSCATLLHPFIGGLAWLLAKLAPQTAVKLLHPCVLKDAEYVLVKVGATLIYQYE